jgi:hypothetical protein
MSELETKINDALEQVKKELVNSYNSKGLRASGKWEKELESFYQNTGNGYQLGILGASYSEQLQNGRLPNKNKSPEGLRAWVGWAGSTFLKDWVKDKGLDISPFAVAWKIAREGVKVPNSFNKGGLVSDAINDETIQRFIEIIKFDQVVSIKSDIRNILSNGNN